MVSRQVEREQNILTYDFFATDIIKEGEVTVDWCPTYDMNADFFTKPNQGSLFKRFRDMIMVLVRQPIYIDNHVHVFRNVNTGVCCENS